ncbi:MAG: HAMP domain-containing sensor histidine kinase [Lutibacter sp.]|uniref:sensor histidine kinase n=1 Tax=Lutibacter sp. TaxID=1925666 RepID=UPI00299D130A|nr:HAMP domain-containing sensor histidine kinase [Lutibacter sp.]MDX1828379.1 HAMP domain-containing sensor histidine kinase [Lutibacter sp.]
MTEKLLHKTQKKYIISAIIILIIISPLFYFISKQIYLNNADEALKLREFQFKQNTISNLKKSDIDLWNKFNTDIKIKPASNLRKETLFFSTYFDEIDQEEEVYREINTPIFIEGNPYTFTAKINMVESEDLMLSIALFFVILILLLLLGFFIINRKITLHLWKPFYDTLHQIEIFEIDKNKLPNLSETNIEEFNNLNNSIQKLVERNSIIYKNQQEFVENAAHELQTPIAIFKAKIDTLIQNKDLTEEQAELVSSIDDTIARLDRLNKNLLLLSKIDNSENYDKEQFSISNLINKQLSFFKEQASQKNIKIEINLIEDFWVEANISLTEILINNLLMNSIRHNSVNGKIKVVISNNRLIISNTGMDKALSKEKIFYRFSKTDNSKQGNGLGLAIAKKIATINNWDISYNYSNKLHSFSVTF